jgi:protein SCO1/2
VVGLESISSVPRPAVDRQGGLSVTISSAPRPAVARPLGRAQCYDSATEPSLTVGLLSVSRIKIRIKFMRLQAILFIALICFSFTPAVAPVKAQATKKAQVQYACPMHPDVTSTKRGRCRKCGMDLRPVTKTTEPAPPVANTDTSISFSSMNIPNVRLVDQNGKPLAFYDDLIKGRIVAINFIFTTCTASCPPLTATFRRVQQTASERGLDIQLISISVDPTVDTPERLHAFAEKFHAGPGWTFVTGDKSEIDSLLRGLGAAVTNKNDHTPMMMIGNDSVDYWTRAYGLSSPSKLVDLIADAASRK